MFKTHHRAALIPPVLACLMFAHAAYASFSGTIEMKYIGVGLGGHVKLDVGGNIFDAFAGEIRFQTRNATGDAAPFGSITLPAFCIEPTQSVQSDWRSYTLSDPAAASTPMMSLERAAALELAVASFMNYRATGAVTNDVASGFQIALWEIMRDYDGSTRASLDLSAGSFKAYATSGAALPSSIAAWASTFFDIAVGPAFTGAQAFALYSPTSQDQIIPQEGAAMLAAIALLATTRRRHRA